MSVPHRLARLLKEQTLRRLSPVLLLLDENFRLLEQHGGPGFYGFPSIEAKSDCRNYIPFLHGLPLDQSFDLDFVETPNGRAVTVRVEPLEDAVAIVMTDVTDERDWRRESQQQANEIRMLSHRQEKLLVQLENAKAELELRHRQAEEANRIKSRFISSMSHEFRTPLTSVLGQVELMRDEGRGAKAEIEAIETIETNASHLLSLIDNILDQAKIESGQLDLNPLSMAPADLCRDMQKMFGPIAHRCHLRFLVESDEALPDAIYVDTTRLRQVIVNLVGNALKFTRQGKVRLALSWAEGRLFCRVEDTGPGIPKQARERIFQAFHQEGGNHEGVGLGLAISVRLVRMMGGELRLESSGPDGSTFTFDIDAPLIKTSDQSDEPTGVLILVADDNVDMRNLLVRYLEKGGFQTIEAEDEESVTRQVREHRPGLLLMDLYMGDSDGAAVSSALRRDGYRGAILILSASSLKEDRQRVQDAGCDGFLVKPICAQQLRAQVAEQLRRYT